MPSSKWLVNRFAVHVQSILHGLLRTELPRSSNQAQKRLTKRLGPLWGGSRGRSVSVLGTERQTLWWSHCSGSVLEGLQPLWSRLECCGVGAWRGVWLWHGMGWREKQYANWKHWNYNTFACVCVWYVQTLHIAKEPATGQYQVIYTSTQMNSKSVSGKSGMEIWRRTGTWGVNGCEAA